MTKKITTRCTSVLLALLMVLSTIVIVPITVLASENTLTIYPRAMTLTGVARLGTYQGQPKVCWIDANSGLSFEIQSPANADATITIRYRSNGRRAALIVNGMSDILYFPDTVNWAWGELETIVSLQHGTNSIGLHGDGHYWAPDIGLVRLTIATPTPETLPESAPEPLPESLPAPLPEPIPEPLSEPAPDLPTPELPPERRPETNLPPVTETDELPTPPPPAITPETNALGAGAVRVTDFVEGAYTLVSALPGGFVLDTNFGGARTPAHLWERILGHENQIIHISHVGEGYYALRGSSGRYLDANNGAVQGTRIISWDWNGNENMQWAIYRLLDGSYVFLNRRAKLVLDFTGGIARNGTILQLWEFNGTDAQRFWLELIGDTAELPPPDPLPDIMLESEHGPEPNYTGDPLHAYCEPSDYDPSFDENALDAFTIQQARATSSAHYNVWTRQQLANEILRRSGSNIPFAQRIYLERQFPRWGNGGVTHANGRSARENIRSAARGEMARTRPGMRDTHLSRYLLKAILVLNDEYGRLEINTIAGATHSSSNSLHYMGQAVDFQRIGQFTNNNHPRGTSRPHPVTTQFLRSQGFTLGWNGVADVSYANIFHLEVLGWRNPEPPRPPGAPAIQFGGSIQNGVMEEGGAIRIRIGDAGNGHSGGSTIIHIINEDTGRTVYHTGSAGWANGLPFPSHQLLTNRSQYRNEQGAVYLSELRELPPGRYRVNAQARSSTQTSPTHGTATFRIIAPTPRPGPPPPTAPTTSISTRNIGEVRWTTRNVTWFHDNNLSRSAGTLAAGTRIRVISILTITENGRARVVARAQPQNGGATRYIDPANLTATFTDSRHGARWTTVDWAGIYPNTDLRSGTAFAVVPRNTRVEARAVIFTPAANFGYRTVVRVVHNNRIGYMRPNLRN